MASTSRTRTLRVRRRGLEDVYVVHEPGAQLSRSLWLSGKLEPVPLCGGLGRCGRCRVRFTGWAPEPLDEERSILGEDLLKLGWRLSCRCRIPDGDDVPEVVELEVPVPEGGRSSEERRTAGVCPDVAQGPFRLAVDLGTTSVAWRLLARDGRVLDEGGCLNPQAGAGADVVSRVAVASTPEGMTVLSRAVRDLFSRLVDRAGGEVEEMVLAANTAMTEIFLEKDVSGLARAPYSRSVEGDAVFYVEGLPPVYVPPQPAPFVGGDITAGLAFLEAEGTPKPYVLADLGTNGEIALVTDRELILTSVPLGPALEGIGLECGALAGPDVLTEFTVGAAGLAGRTASGVPLSDGAVFRGIGATGYLSLVALLRGCGVMTVDGQFADKDSVRVPLAARLAARVDREADIPRFVVAPGLWMSLRDVEEILKVKAAFAVALESLLEAGGLDAAKLRRLVLAGALGGHVQPRVLEALGFVPGGTGRALQAVGNSALAGAVLLARETGARERLADLCGRARLLQPALESDFHERYVRAMHFQPA